MASPYLMFDDLTTLAVEGGYVNSPALTNLSAVFLLSACTFLSEKWLWQNPISPIDDTTYKNILDMIAETEYQLMVSINIGTLIPSVVPKVVENWLLMDGSSYDPADYPELAAVVPAAWLGGGMINLPDMQDAGLFGSNNAGLVGTFVGENDHQLTTAEMPTHTHTQNPHSHSYTLTTGIPTAAGIEPTFADVTTQTPAITGATTATNNDEGGDQPHNNVQNSMLVYWYIVAR